MTSCFVCANLNSSRKKSTGMEPYLIYSQDKNYDTDNASLSVRSCWLSKPCMCDKVI